MADCLLSCDWGTSTFRLQLVDRASQEPLTDPFTSDRGVASFRCHSSRPAAEGFSRYLLQSMGMLNAPPAPVVISGMASSSIGWQELAYARVPFSILSLCDANHSCVTLEYRSSVVPVYLLSGVQSDIDVMRGEETQLAGLFSTPEFAAFAADRCRVILPGTHSKHALIRNGDLVDFTTFMTGELVSVLANRSILKNSTDWEDFTHSGVCLGDHFADGVRAARDSSLSASLFRVRSRSLLRRESPAANTEFLLGLLIGDELRGISLKSREIPVVLAAAERFQDSYRRALEILDVPSGQLECIPSDVVSLATVRAHVSWLNQRDS